MSQPVVMYTKTTCPYCVMAKRLLTMRGITFEEINVEKWPDDQRQALMKRSGMRTVPQIFHGDRLIGGYDDLHALDEKEGNLDSLKA
ncbi:MAG TPA: glutaredoxin 3 [Bdellovibrionota bacterium]|jgi:glutaredoxin 3|nr:glutaredoxin 3 [Bdellovibrionota bacterium]